MKTFHDIENALRDYHWMLKEIERLKEELKSVNSNVTPVYGIESSMPKGSGTSDKVGNEVVNRDRKQKTIQKFGAKVQFIHDNSDCITDDRELTVLNCMLDGMSIVAISQHMGFSERKVYTIKDDVVRKMKENAGNAGNASIAG